MTGTSDFAVTLLSSAGTSAVLSGTLVWLLRTWIGERVRGEIQTEYAAKLETIRVQLKADADAKLESHKAVLKAQGDVEVEKLRASLAIASAARHAEYGGLVPRRFDAIERTYANLLRLQQVVQRLLELGVSEPGHYDPEARQREIDEALQTFETDYVRQKIYLTNPTVARIDAIREKLLYNAKFFPLIFTLPFLEPERLYSEVQEKVKKEIPAALKDLEADLRALMGDGPDSAPTTPGVTPMPEEE
jgi:hypothetical protein